MQARAHDGGTRLRDPFGGNLDDEGREIDFCADAIRIKVETAMVETLAETFATRHATAG